MNYFKNKSTVKWGATYSWWLTASLIIKGILETSFSLWESSSAEYESQINDKRGKLEKSGGESDR